MKKEFIIQTSETMFDLEYIYYLKSNKTKSIIFKVCDEYDIQETFDLIKKSNNKIKNIIQTLNNEWDKKRFFSGLPTIENGGLITKKTAESIVQHIRDKYQKIKTNAENNKTEFIDFLKNEGLEPIPSGGNEFSWYPKCPYSVGKHFIVVSTKDDSFGCGYCGKKGGQEELEDFINKQNI